MNHILPVVRIAGELAEELSADRDIVAAAAYLHDIGRVVFLYRWHAAVGATLARLVLPLLGYTPAQARRVAACIRAHRGAPFPTLEAEIVANADAAAQLENPLYLLAIHFATHGRDLAATRAWLRAKYARDWQTKLTLPAARRRVEGEYERIKKYLYDMQ
jgi:HD superfamily phosphodiesterase